MGNSNEKFNAKTTALQAADGVDFTTKVAIVTGANTGIGKETTYVLAHQGATVIMGCRDQKRGDEAKQDIINRLNKDEDLKTKVTDDRIIVLILDLSSLKSIKQFVRDFYALNLPLHCLVNNAGVMAIPQYTKTINGLEMQFGTNHIGHYYLTRLLLSKLLESKPSRIINVSSAAHSSAPKPFQNVIDDMVNREDGPLANNYKAWTNYGTSKSCNILFARELDHRYFSEGIISVSLHPGVIPTELSRHMGSTVRNVFMMGKFMMKTIPQGASTTVRCISLSQDEVKHGGYYLDCQFADDKLRKDLKPTSYENWDKDSLESKLWNLSEKIIMKKGASFNLNDNDKVIEEKEEEKKAEIQEEKKRRNCSTR